MTGQPMVRRAALVALISLAGALAGCLQTASSNCEGGGICPPGLRCAKAGDQLICVQPTCGNSVKDRGEACDDGNNVSGDGCPANCGPPCGDGIRDPDEACDDGNVIGGDGCSADCRSREVCANGVLDPGEACDDGSPRDHDGCSSRCVVEQPEWSAAGINPTSGGASVYDAARGVTVLVQNSANASSVRTWEWDGTAWRERSSRTAPAFPGGAVLIYDAAQRRVVALGTGHDGWTAWAWDGVDWTEEPPAAAPPRGLTEYAIAYDVIRNKAVLFGGGLVTSVNTLDWQRSTWEWDGTTWEQVTTQTVPPERGGHAMAYDSRRGVVVMYGGENNLGVPDDVWEYDGNDWTRHQSASFPAPNLFAGAMVFDAAHGAVAMIGGFSASPDLWEWDGTEWKRYRSLSTPLSRFSPAVSYDLARRTLVMFGGWVDAGQSAVPVNDTWEWNGTAWSERAVRTLARQGGGMAYDSALDRVVVFGGNEFNELDESAADTGAGLLNDAWRWDGANWVAALPPDAFAVEPNTTPPRSPSARSAFATAALGQEIMVWGGLGATGVLDDGWFLLNGFWSQLVPGFRIQPPARWHHAMAYDVPRNKLIMFGGLSAAGEPLADTWAWDSQDNWAMLGPAHVPPSRRSHAMAWDAVRQRIVMFGGDHGDALLTDTWIWDGTDWSAHSSSAPPARRDHAMAFDAARGRLVLFGGDGGDALFADTWEWDGTTWLRRTPTTIPPARSAHMMAYDAGRGRVVLFGGRDRSQVFDDVWEWDGTNWQRVVYRSSPPARSRHAIAYDIARTAAVMFGGVDLRGARLNDTWIWDGSDWRAAEPAVAPPARAEHAMAFDPVRGRAVLFGGGSADRNAPDGVTRLADTWEWDGATWIEQHPATSPPPRRGHAMAYDAARGTTVLFGGEQRGALLGDQWTWDGARWTPIAPATAPPGRTEFSLAYDERRARVVLFGGRGAAGRLSDVWEWDGTSWTDRTPPTVYVPAARTGASLIYDPARRRVVVFGGQSDTASLNDSWEWDGTTWTPLTPTVLPAPRHHQAMVYDAAHSSALMFGGDDGSPRPLRDTWFLRYEDPAISFEACRAGMDLDGDGDAGCDDPDCAAYCAACGDGVCDASEDCRLCPADCGSCPLCGDLQCDAGESCTTCPADCGLCGDRASHGARGRKSPP